MYQRSPNSFDIQDALVEKISSDPVAPVTQMVARIAPGSTILDIGVGNGILARALQLAGKNAVLDGIEPVDRAVDIASGLYRHVYNGTFEEVASQLDLGSYDWVVMADVLEHMADPLWCLATLRKGLKADARLMASVPNIGFGSIALELLRGRFVYRDLGLLDRTHLHFFTRDSLTELLKEAGFSIREIVHLVRAIPSMEIPVRSGVLELLMLPWLSFQLPSTTYQYIAVAGTGPGSMETRIIRDGSPARRLRQILEVYARPFRTGAKLARAIVSRLRS